VSVRGPGTRTSASDRVARLLAIIPWIAAQDGTTIDEVCERFAVTRAQLAGDLERLMLVGIPPYTPDTLIDVTIDGDRVWLRFADVFARPLRLTPEQGLALVAAGSALRGLPGADPDGPLATALGKVAGVLDVDPDEAISVALGKIRLDVLDTLRQATRERRRIRLDYYAYGRDERRSRTVDPYAVFADEGAWYVRGHCHLAGGERLFRVDRVVSVTPTDEGFELPAGFDPAEHSAVPLHFTGDDSTECVLALDPGATWLAARLPLLGSSPLPDGRLAVRFAARELGWAIRLVLRMAPDAVPLGPPALRTAVADAAAALARTNA
jgi:proteasome accessory factor C